MLVDSSQLKPPQSLFPRVQLDPLEKDWLRSSALGNMAAQRRLLCQESSLVMKKVRHSSKKIPSKSTTQQCGSGTSVNQYLLGKARL